MAVVGRAARAAKQGMSSASWRVTPEIPSSDMVSGKNETGCLEKKVAAMGNRRVEPISIVEMAVRAVVIRDRE